MLSAALSVATPLRVRNLADARSLTPASGDRADQDASQRMVAALSPDGREQGVGLKFRGDWLGFDGIANGQYSCDPIAMDTGEVWTIRYDALLAACSSHPALLTVLHESMSREITRDRNSLMSVCTLPADARVADFLRYWAESLARRGLRADQITLRQCLAPVPTLQ